MGAEEGERIQKEGERAPLPGLAKGGDEGGGDEAAGEAKTPSERNGTYEGLPGAS